MASILNASTSSGVVISPDTSGNLTIQSNGTNVAIISATGVNAGIQVASFAAPAFCAYLSSNQSITSGVDTKVTFNTTNFDTASAFSTVNSRFQPTVAGYYQFSSAISLASQGGNFIISIYKTGSIVSEFIRVNTNYGSQTSYSGSCLMYLNGSTDYAEIYCYSTNNNTVQSGLRFSWFTGGLVRSA